MGSAEDIWVPLGCEDIAAYCWSSLCDDQSHYHHAVLKMVQYLAQNIPRNVKHISRLVKEYQTCPGNSYSDQMQ